MLSCRRELGEGMKKEEFVRFYSSLSAEKRQITRKMLKERGIDFASFPIGRRPPEVMQVSLSFSQQRLWFLDKLDPYNPSYNIPTAVRLLGALDIEVLGRTFDSIVHRHEALRTSFDEVDGMPIQIVHPERGMPLPITDLSGLPEVERQGRAQAVVQAEAERPFNLAADSLIRGGLIRLSAVDHILYVTLHHIVSDGWSIGVLIKEMAALYGAYVKGEPLSLPDLPVQYGDFAYWQRDWMTDEVLQQQLAYWSRQLEGMPPLLELPLDHPRPAVQTHRGATLPLTIPPAITASLHVIGKQAQATLFMTLAAAFNVFLARYSSQDDIALGTVIANRNRPEIEGLIGFFTNTLVLRTRVDESLSFLDLLHQVRDTALGAYANQDVPFEQLFEVLRPERNTSHSALFQVMMVLHNTSTATLDLPGLALRPVMTEGSTSKFDLSLYLAEGNGQLNGGLEYNIDLFEPATVQRMARHFMHLLGAIAANPRARVVDLPLLEPDDASVLQAWNMTREQYPQRTLGDLFEAQAARTPEYVAVVDTREELSYAELNRRANRLAHRLRAAGVGPERRVAICLERSSQMIVALLAVLKAGGAYVPLDPANPLDRLSYLLTDSHPLVLVTQEHLREGLPSGAYSVICLDIDGDQQALADFPEYNPVPSAQPGNAAYVIYTSGTSGGPKGVINTHRSVVNHLIAHAAKCGMDADDRVLQFASLNFDASVEEIFPPLIVGATVVVRPAELLDTGAAFSAFIERHRITVLDLPTAFWHTWTLALEASDAGVPFGVRLVIVGGEKALLDRLLAWRKLRGGESVRWLNTYGPTETTVSVLTHDIEQERLPDLHEVPIGRPLSNIHAHVLDRHLRPVPVGVVGELYIGGVGLARGYLDRPALTAERFVPDAFGDEPGERLYRTGDLARYRPDGTLEYAGRADSQIKLRGFRIEPGEIEAALAGLPSVREAAVLAREDRPGDMRLVAYVSLRTGLPADPNDLRMALQRCLPDYMVPSAFVLLDSLPLNASGKLDRRALPAPSAMHGDEGYVAASTPVEEVLVETWKELLHLDKVGVRDNFFHLGGHSLLATQLVSKLRDSLGVELPLRTLFEHPTIEFLAASVTALHLNSANIAITHDQVEEGLL